LFPEAPGARGGRSLSTICAGLLICGGSTYPAIAWAKDGLTVDMTAGLEGATNPYLETGGGNATVGARGTIDADYRISSRRSSIELRGSGNVSTYFNGRSSDFGAGVGANVQHRLSSAVTMQLQGHYNYTQSSGGGYFATTPGFTNLPPLTPPGPTTPTTTPVAPPPPAGIIGLPLPTDVTLIGRRLTEQSFGGDINFDIRTGARSSLGLAANVNRVIYDDPVLSNYRSLSQAASFSRRTSETTTLSALVRLAEIRYDNGENDTIISPMVGVNHRLSRIFDLSVFAGASVLRSRLPDGTRINQSSLALSGTLCGQHERSKLCVNASRLESPTAFGGVRPITTVNATYAREFKPGDSLNLSLQVDRSGRDTRRLFAPQTTFQGTARYDHRLSGRVGVFGSVAYLRLWETCASSRSDLRAVIGIALKLGDRG